MFLNGALTLLTATYVEFITRNFWYCSKLDRELFPGKYGVHVRHIRRSFVLEWERWSGTCYSSPRSRKSAAPPGRPVHPRQKPK